MRELYVHERLALFPRPTAFLAPLAIFFLWFHNPAAAQSFDLFGSDKATVAANETVTFKIRLRSDTDTFACAFEIDFGDGSERRKIRVFSEKDATVEVNHTYRSPGVYAAKVDGALSLLDEGLSIKSFKSLLPALPCEGSRAFALNVVAAGDQTGCIPPSDESREIPCSDGLTGRVVQRRSFSCPGPTPQQWVTESSDCRVKPGSEGSGVEVGAAELINRGWASFVGRSGIVDEFEAFRLTAEGVQKARSAKSQGVKSIGINNLRVIHMCARDPRVRDYSFGRKVGSTEVGRNRYSSDNYIWGVFLRAEEADSDAFISFLKKELRSHPVTGYIEKNSGRLPRNSAEAVRILKLAADRSDHDAAKWVGYFYECGPAAIDIASALKWMSLAAENAEKNGAHDGVRKSINDRLTRLKLLNQP
jgi:hypothetical protein